MAASKICGPNCDHKSLTTNLRLTTNLDHKSLDHKSLDHKSRPRLVAGATGQPGARDRGGCDF
jgi:hypothetical protein